MARWSEVITRTRRGPAEGGEEAEAVGGGRKKEGEAEEEEEARRLGRGKEGERRGRRQVLGTTNGRRRREVVGWAKSDIARAAPAARGKGIGRWATAVVGCVTA